MKKRLHLFEFHDQPWFPALWRDYLTDFMSLYAVRFRPYRAVVPVLLPMLSAESRMVDLCSGAGGPVEALILACRDEGNGAFAGLRVALTDKFPNPEAYRDLQSRWPAHVSFVESPVDATCVPPDLAGFRTLFTAFHHFRPETARAVLADAVTRQQPVGVFEYTERSLRRWALPLLCSPLLLWAVTPSLKPFRWGRLFWTYVLPVIPLAGIWDGAVSCLRTYSPEELLWLARSADPAGGFEWQAGKLRSRGAPNVTYLVGKPAGAAGC